jgi:nucleotidyltransferase/DNA polymerase involved in DNA repair
MVKNDERERVVSVLSMGRREKYMLAVIYGYAQQICKTSQQGIPHNGALTRTIGVGDSPAISNMALNWAADVRGN